MAKSIYLYAILLNLSPDRSLILYKDIIGEVNMNIHIIEEDRSLAYGDIKFGQYFRVLYKGKYENCCLCQNRQGGNDFVVNLQTGQTYPYDFIPKSANVQILTRMNTDPLVYFKRYADLLQGEVFIYKEGMYMKIDAKDNMVFDIQISIIKGVDIDRYDTVMCIPNFSIECSINT